MPQLDFFVIGDTQFDTVMILDPEEVEVKCEINRTNCMMCLDYAGKVPVSQFYEMVAGNAANAAVAAARLDGKTGLWTILGHDEIANRELRHFQDEGIDTTFVRKTPGCQSNRSNVISVSGERTLLVYHAPRTYALPADLPTSAWVYLTSMAKGSELIFTELARYLDQNGTKVVFQPGTFQLRVGSKAARPILERTELIVMNKEEAQFYTGSTSDDIGTLVAALRELGPKIAVITDSQEGSYASDDQTTWYLGTRPEVPRIEVTGAGDAYASAFSAALFHGQSIPEAMRWGTFNAESVIQRIGPQAGILTKHQLEDELARFPQFIAQPWDGRTL